MIHEPGARCTSWPHWRHCRRRVHGAFFQWYAASEQRFAIKLELLKRTDTCLEIGFRKFNRVVTATLVDGEMSIPVIWEGICWDVLCWFETYPKRIPGGYVCDECPEDTRPIFPTREALWRAEVFEPFLEWVNSDLANAVAVSISGSPGRITWARLVPNTIE